jgi:hypothetical protein
MGGSGLGNTPTPGEYINFVFMLGILSFSFDSVDFHEHV